MCPVGYALTQTLMAWSFASGAWVQIDLCYNDDTLQGTSVRDDNGKEVNIYQVTIKDHAFWVIDEDKENCDE